MQNNNETNENVNKVVAEFFKKKPLQKNNDNKRPYQPNQYKQKSNTQEPVKAEGQATQSVKDNDSKPQNDRLNRDFRKNNKRQGKPFYGKKQTNNVETEDRITSDATTQNLQAIVEDGETPEQNALACAEAPASLENIKPDTSKTENEAEWYDPESTVEIIGVRFKAGGKIYYFSPNNVTAQKNDSVIVETSRGLEFGTVMTPNTEVKLREVVMPLKNVVRIATDDDVQKHKENQAKVVEALRICNEKIAAHKLEMKLVDVEYTFDNSKLLFYFTSDGRVDFRELVKDLAGVFKTRIELRQIGIREETKLLGGIGICGLPFCCKAFLSDFVQVSIKMAKEQGLSLNSAKISGACGRLMCCLRYEYDTYDDEIRRTPKVDTKVITPDGIGIVCDTQPLAGLCKVKFVTNDETVIKVYHRDDLKRADSSDEKGANVKGES